MTGKISQVILSCPSFNLEGGWNESNAYNEEWDPEGGKSQE